MLLKLSSSRFDVDRFHISVEMGERIKKEQKKKHKQMANEISLRPFKVHIALRQSSSKMNQFVSFIGLTLRSAIPWKAKIVI